MESIKVEANEYYYKKKPITVTRDYYGLSSADTTNIPKNITENGKTLNLENIEWKTSNVIEMNGQEVANRYSATANYKTTVTNTGSDTDVTQKNNTTNTTACQFLY